MARFRYSMQSILNIKLKMETQAKQAFSSAKARLDTEEEKLEALKERKIQYQERATELLSGVLNFRDIEENKTAILCMEDLIQNQKKRVDEANRELEKARKELTEVMIERKTHESLRDKAFEQFLEEEKKNEGKEVDELTSYTYRKKRRNMAKQQTPETVSAEEEKKKIEEEKKKLKKEQKEQRREAKRRAKEIAKQEEALGEEDGNGIVTFGATILIVLLWIAVICVIVKLDIGGFGSSVLTPVLKDVPVINKILPGTSLTETTDGEEYGGYTSLKDAVAYIRQLELELERVQTASAAKDETIDSLNAEVARLKQFEDKQVDFQRIQKEFYDEVIYSDKGPGAEEYRKWYEEMDPATAEYLYKQVVTQLEESQEIQDYAQAYADMKPKQAAAIFETMTDDLNLVAKILNAMSIESRANILGAMDSTIAGKLTKIMNPDT